MTKLFIENTLIMYRLPIKELTCLVVCMWILIQQNTYSQCFQKISSKFDQVVAINYDSTLWTWGGFRFNQGFSRPVRIDSSKNWKEISTGRGYAMAIKSDGILWGWGDNSFGQLGDGTTVNKWTLTRLTADSNWAKVSCGDHFTIAIKNNGTVWFWGRNNYGQLGQGTNRTNSSIPVQLGLDSNFVEISGGRDFTLLKKSNHSLWHVGACYSSSISSQLTQVGSSNSWSTMSGGSYTNFAIQQNGTLWKFVSTNGRPAGLSQVGTDMDWRKVNNSHTYSTEYHALFIKVNGSLWAIGDNRFGQFGNGSLTASTVPVQVGTDTDWKTVVAGQHSSFALKTNNSFWAWGRNNYAQFGNGEHKNMILPVDNSRQWKTVELSGGSSYNGHALAIQQNGSLWSWGTNHDGQLGIGTSYNHQALPVQVGTDTDWKSITNGFHFSIGVKTDGTLWGWGRNGRSQLGMAGSFDRNVPTQIGLDSNWSTVSAGSEFVIALKNDSTLWSWGYNFNGQLGHGNTSTLNTPTQVGTDSNWIMISAGGHHSLALKSDSTLWSWGSNQHGRIGRSGSKLVPIQVGIKKWVDISGGGLHSIGIQEDSTMWAFGRNLYAQLGDNSTSSRFTPVQIGNTQKWKRAEAGYEHSIAINSDSTLWTWGRNAFGELADSLSYGYKAFVPTKVSETKWKGINAGTKGSAVIKLDGTLFTFGDAYNPEYQNNFPILGYVQSTPKLINNCGICIPTGSQSNSAICQGSTYLFNGRSLSTSGVYRDTLVNASGCDSIVVLTLLVKANTSSIDTIFACDSYTWINGTTYTTSNTTDKDTLINSLGCDSVVTLNLMLQTSSTFTDVISSCGSYTWIDGKIYTTSNFVAKDTLVNNKGCDSIVTLNLTVTNIDKTIVVSGITLTSNEVGVTYQWLDCNNAFAIISGETSQTYIPNVNGNYAVEITKNSCVDTSLCESINSVGMEENKLLQLIDLFPNPTTDGFQLVFSRPLDNVSITLMDIQGKEIQKRFYFRVASMEFDNLPESGLYLVRIQSGEEVGVLKVIKE